MIFVIDRSISKIHSFFFIRTSNFDAEAERSYIFWRFEAETFLKMFLKERRILITHWVGEAYKKLAGSEYDNLRLRVWQKTGCLMTADGSEDGLIKPEGLKSYIVPPPFLIYSQPEECS